MLLFVSGCGKTFIYVVLQSITPGPGTYGKGGVPAAIIEEKQKKSMSTVGMLDAVSSSARYVKSQVE